MPKKLPYTTEKHTLLLVKSDMDLIHSIHPNLNEFMRLLTGAYASKLRAQPRTDTATPQRTLPSGHQSMTIEEASVYLHSGWTVTRLAWANPAFTLRKVGEGPRAVFKASDHRMTISAVDLSADDWVNVAQHH